MPSSYDSNDKKLEQGWVFLASVDEASPWEVDENTILYNPATKKFLWREASGCSCWDGEYGEEEYDSLDVIEAELNKDVDTHRYHPTIKGGEALIAEAREAFLKGKF